MIRIVFNNLRKMYINEYKGSYAKAKKLEGTLVKVSVKLSVKIP